MSDNGLTWTPRIELAFQAVADLLISGRISNGQDRAVYALAQNPELVLKVSNRDTSQNTLEYEIWQHVKDTEHAKWFAPVVSASGDGTCLLMHRTTERPHSEYPEKLPSFFTDTKYANYGWLGDQFVCHDYGVTNLLTMGLAKRMKKVEWWQG